MTPEQRRQLFYNFLIENDAWTAWWNNVSKASTIWSKPETVFDQNDYNKCIFDMFGLKTTPEGEDYWSDLGRAWTDKFK